MHTSELLGLSPTVIGNEQVAVVLDKSSLQLVLGVLINVLLVVGDDGLGDSLTDGIDLRSVTTTGDTDTDIDTSKLVGTDDQERLVDLHSGGCFVRTLQTSLFLLPSRDELEFGKETVNLLRARTLKRRISG